VRQSAPEDQFASTEFGRGPRASLNFAPKESAPIPLVPEFSREVRVAANKESNNIAADRSPFIPRESGVPDCDPAPILRQPGGKMIIVNSVLLILAVVSRVGEFYSFSCALPLFAAKRVIRCKSKNNASSLIDIIYIRVIHVVSLSSLIFNILCVNFTKVPQVKNVT